MLILLIMEKKDIVNQKIGGQCLHNLINNNNRMQITKIIKLMKMIIKDKAYKIKKKLVF